MQPSRICFRATSLLFARALNRLDVPAVIPRPRLARFFSVHLPRLALAQPLPIEEEFDTPLYTDIMIEDIHNIDGHKPELLLDDGQSVQCSSETSSSVYTIKRINGLSDSIRRDCNS